MVTKLLYYCSFNLKLRHSTIKCSTGKLSFPQILFENCLQFQNSFFPKQFSKVHIFSFQTNNNFISFGKKAFVVNDFEKYSGMVEDLLNAENCNLLMFLTIGYLFFFEFPFLILIMKFPMLLHCKIGDCQNFQSYLHPDSFHTIK